MYRVTLAFSHTTHQVNLLHAQLKEASDRKTQ